MPRPDRPLTSRTPAALGGIATASAAQAQPGALDIAPPAPGFARLERFWQAHADAVFRAAYRITGQAADAEDVLQTVFLRLTRRLGSLDPEGVPTLAVNEHEAGAYLQRSAVNAALDVIRSRQRAGWVPLETAPVSGARGGGAAGGVGVDGAFGVSGPDPEREQSNRELRIHLRLAIARLSPRAAEIFALRYFEDLPNREIAKLLGISQGLVAVLLHRTRARLRKELAALHGGVR